MFYIGHMIRKPYILIPFFALLFFSSILFAGAALKFIQGHSESDNIIIEWQTEKEFNIKSFTVERKTPNGSFVGIATVSPKGDYSYYRFVDEGVYKTADRLYTYRVKIDDGTYVTYSAEVPVAISLSDVKRTWGSIKALFR